MNMSHDGVIVMIMKYYFDLSIKIFDVGKFNTKLCSPKCWGEPEQAPQLARSMAAWYMIVSQFITLYVDGWAELS